MRGREWEKVRIDRVYRVYFPFAPRRDSDAAQNQGHNILGWRDVETRFRISAGNRRAGLAQVIYRDSFNRVKLPFIELNNDQRSL